MKTKISMEGYLPLKTELAMYRDFLTVLMPNKRSNPIEEKFWLDALEALNSASGDLSSLCRLGAEPGDYPDAESYFRAAQFSALFRKRNDVGDCSARELAALQSFIRAEDACRDTNILLQRLRVGALGPREAIVFPGTLYTILHCARREARTILGRCPELDMLPCYFGPGATTQVVRKLANPRVKLGQEFACSESMLPVLKTVLEGMPDFVFREYSCEDVSATVSVQIHDAKLSFVPKNFKTYRSIAVEPWLNSFFQLGVGRMIARRLEFFGLDIKDQTANQKLALLGSIDGSLATIDLSSASDCIAIELVREILPDDWWHLLVHLRSSHLEYNGVRTKLEKFSSMGNGFTFPLQTLIFYSLAKAVCQSLGLPVNNVRAYGDDIIVPVEAYERLHATLALFGFTVNGEKSFHEGPFRESCGCDYWQGIDVRPMFLSNRPNFFDLFSLHNGFIRKGKPELAAIVKRYIPDPLVLLGPDGYGDGHLIGYPFAQAVKFKAEHKRRGYGGYTFDTYSRKGRKYVRPHAGDYLYPSYSIYRRGGTDWVLDDRPQLCGNTIPGTSGYRRMSIYTLDLASIEA